MIVATLLYLQANYPRVFSWSHWLNLGFTGSNLLLNHDLLLKTLAFLFVTVPLGVVQWWNLLDKWRERRAKKHGN